MEEVSSGDKNSEFRKHSSVGKTLLNQNEKAHLLYAEPATSHTPRFTVSITTKVTISHTGPDVFCLQDMYGIGYSTVNPIIIDTCKAIYHCLLPNYMNVSVDPLPPKSGIASCEALVYICSNK